MFNKLKTTTLAVVTAAATLLGSGQAWAFQSTVVLSQGPSGVQLGNCTVYMTYDVQDAPGSLNILVGGLTNSIIPFWYSSVSRPSGTFGRVQLTLSNIQACGISDADPATFVFDGANGTFASDGYYGFSVEGTDPVSGDYSLWEFAFTGVSATTLIARRTLATPPETTPPTVTLSSSTTTLNGTAPFTVTATFNEAVSVFDPINEPGDITISGGTITAITGGPSAYTLTVTPTGVGDVSITVPDGAAQDAASNDNIASTTLTIGNTVEDTQRAIAGFMLGRAGNLASNQPGLTRFMQGTGCGSFNANATAGSGSVNGCVSQGNMWADLNSSWSGDSSYTLGSFGAHGFVNPNLLIGGMFQLDYADDEANKISGTGWMVGPYFVAQVPDQPLFLEGRLLYGQTDNDISPLGTYTDSFGTERMLAQLRATGEYQYQATTLMPLFDLTYTDDEAQTYTDSLGNVIPGQKVSIMQISAGMDFSTPIAVQSGALDLTGGLSAIHASTSGGGADFEGTRGRATLGLNYGLENGANLSVGTFYDGIGSDYGSRGANLSFDMKF